MDLFLCPQVLCSNRPARLPQSTFSSNVLFGLLDDHHIRCLVPNNPLDHTVPLRGQLYLTLDLLGFQHDSTQRVWLDLMMDLSALNLPSIWKTALLLHSFDHVHLHPVLVFVDDHLIIEKVLRFNQAI